jgi:hypothetical protein
MRISKDVLKQKSMKKIKSERRINYQYAEKKEIISLNYSNSLITNKTIR